MSTKQKLAIAAAVVGIVAIKAAEIWCYLAAGILIRMI